MSKSPLKRGVSRFNLVRFLAVAAIITSSHIAFGAPITVVNGDFEDVSGLTPSNGSDPTFSLDNTLDLNSSSQFGGSSGWKEYNSSGVAAQVNGNGVINVGRVGGDFTLESPGAGDDGPGTDGTNPRIAAYIGTNSATLRQTTGHLISALDTSFTLTVDVGDDTFTTLAGYVISLYAFNSGSNTTSLLKTVTSSDVGAVNPGNDAWATITLSLAPTDFSLFVGEAIGISLAKDTVSPYTRDVYMDNVTLNYTATPAPEPSSLLLLGAGGFGMIAVARQRNRRPSTTRSLQS